MKGIISEYRTLIREKEDNFQNQITNNPIKFRQKLHVMPPVGWLNDPNGLCQVGEFYHLFFQYSPFDAKGGLKMWGHYISFDMIAWTYLHTPILPDTYFDYHGAYSGSALIDDGTMYLYYTGNVKLTDNDHKYDYINEGRESNTMVITSEDSLFFSNKKLLMTNRNYPDDMSCHVRDPKVWKDGDTFYMIQGARTKDSVGLALIFTSSDKKKWEYKCRLQTDKPFGYMWECPDYFVLDGKKILAICPQGADYRDTTNVYLSGYFMVDGDILGDYKLSEFRLLDYGFDFYAPQTFTDKKGRRILIGWMGMIDCDYVNPTVDDGWQHCMTFPRELFIKDGIIHQRPIREIEKIICNTLTLQDKFAIMDIRVYSLNITGITNNNFKIIISKKLKLEYVNGRFQMKFTTQFKDSISGGRDLRYVETPNVKNIRILVDESSVEVFVNDGEFVFSTRYYPNIYVIKVEAPGATIEFSQFNLPREDCYGFRYDYDKYDDEDDE